MVGHWKIFRGLKDRLKTFKACIAYCDPETSQKNIYESLGILGTYFELRQRYFSHSNLKLSLVNLLILQKLNSIFRGIKRGI